MDLKLVRETFTDKSTIGKLYMNGKFFCYTLEDVVRAEKIKHETAIPYGVYEVIVNWSNRFKQQMPLLLRVPNFEGVRIHWGNYSKDTDGCILLGKTKGDDFIGQSKTTYANFMNIMNEVSKSEKISIEIIK